MIVLVSYLVLNRKYPKANNMAGLDVPLAIYALVSDALFLYSGYWSANFSIFISFLVFAVVPIFFNLIIVGRIFVSIRHDPNMQRWLDGNATITAAIMILAICNIQVVFLLNSKMFNKAMFSAPFSKKIVIMLTFAGLVWNVLEDIPQLVVLIFALRESLDTYTLLSIIASTLSITFGIVRKGIVVLVARFSNSTSSYQRQQDEDEPDGGNLTSYTNFNDEKGASS